MCLDSITDLIAKFQNMDISDIPSCKEPKDKDPQCNFVLIFHSFYHGGFMYNSILKHYSKSKHLSSPINKNVSLV